MSNAALEICSSADDEIIGAQSQPATQTAGIVSPKQYAVTLVCPPGYVHSLALLEIAETLNHALANIGVDSMLTDKFDEPGRCHIVLGAHLLSKFAMEPLKPDSIIYNFEQIDPASPWLEDSYLSLLRTHEVWDYSERNILLLQRQGVSNIRHVPLGYVAQMERIKPEVQDIDVLFYGSINPRRQAVLDALKAAGLKVKQVFNFYGPPRDELIARSKIVLNLHFYESKIFEVARVSYLLSNGVCVVSETGDDPIEQEYAEALAFAPYEALAETCLTLIADPDRRQVIAQRGQEFMRTLPQEQFLNQVLSGSGKHRNDGVLVNHTATQPLDKHRSPATVHSKPTHRSAPRPTPRPALSICIPTYNRADTLRVSLESIVKQDYFQHTGLVEIAVSDNCSTDHTQVLMEEYQARFPGLIRYRRNNENLFDLNLERALALGTGQFLKLHNDTFGVDAGILELLVKIISHFAAEKPVLFMVNETPVTADGALLNFDTIDAFLAHVSYKCTWGGGFGIWHEDFQGMSDFSRKADKRLVQTDVLLRMMATKKRAVVINALMFLYFGHGRKSGYNVAEVFGANYLEILREHVETGDLSQEGYAQEKKRILIEHTLPFVFSRDHDFENDRLEHHLRDYSSEDYFLPALERAAKGNTKLSPTSTHGADPGSFSDKWRRANAHNDTTPAFEMPLSKVLIGRRTYGQISAHYWGHPDEYLQIGSFCSIGGGVDFMLGGNHFMKGFSTYPFKVKLLGEQTEALSKGPIVVEDDVWIGNRTMILSGVRIGQGAVIGACSVVTADVPPYAVVCGNPARVVKYRFEPDVIEELLKLDYSILSDHALRRHAAILYESITADNVRRFVADLMHDENESSPSLQARQAVLEQ